MTRRTENTPPATDLDEAVIGPDDPLTTKEGWARFVDHQPTPPELHSAAVLQQTSPRDRVGYDEAGGIITATRRW